MLNKHNFNIAKVASKKESRYTLTGILVEPGATVCTDGHRLIWVSETETSVENFPVVPIKASKDYKPFLLDRDLALKIAKAVPKERSLPALNHVAINVDAETGEQTLAVTDLETPQVFTPKPMAGNFPNYRVVMPTGEPEFTMGFNPKYMAEIFALFAEFCAGGREPVRISFYKEDGPLRFDAVNTNTGQGMTAVLMPMRDGSEPKPNTYGYAERMAKRDAVEEKKAARAKAKAAETETPVTEAVPEPVAA